MSNNASTSNNVSMSSNVSEQKRVANRRNARKSTGPKSPAGKARSSRNALKHGLLAREVVIREGDGAERRADFDALLADLHDELEPHGLIEETLVERIATCYWRLRRAQRYEVGAIRDSLDECDRDVDDPGVETAKDIHKRLTRAEDRLADEQAILEDLMNPSDPDSPNSPARLEATAKNLAAAHGLGKPPRTGEEIHRDLLESTRDRIPSLRLEVERLRVEFEAAERYDALRQSRRALTGSLPAETSLLKLVRYETMLDRQMHRALNELRRRQEARASADDPAPISDGHPPKPDDSARSSSPLGKGGQRGGPGCHAHAPIRTPARSSRPDASSGPESNPERRRGHGIEPPTTIPTAPNPQSPIRDRESRFTKRSHRRTEDGRPKAPEAANA